MNSAQSSNPQSSDDETFELMEIEKENKDLRKMNSQLIEQLSSLKQQYNEALLANKNFNDLQEKIQSLSNDLLVANSQKDELSHRLDISLQSNKELQKLNSELENKNNDYSKLVENEKESNKIISDYTNKIEELNSKIELQQEDIAQKDRDINNLISFLQQYFNQSFSTIPSIQLFLFENPLSSIQKPCLCSQLEKEVENLNSKLKKTTLALKAINKAKEEAEMKNAQLEYDFSIFQEQKKEDIAELELKVSSLIKKIERNDLIYEQNNSANKETIKSLEGQIQKLKEKLQIEKQKRMAKLSTDNSNSLIKNNIDLINKLKDEITQQKENVIALENQNSKLIAQLQSSDKIRDGNKKTINSLQTKINDLENECDELKHQISNYEIQIQSFQEQVQSANSQIQAAKTSYNQAKTAVVQSESQQSKIKQAYFVLEENFEKQSKEIQQLFDQRQKMLEILQKQTNLLFIYENKLSEEHSIQEQLKNKIHSLNIQQLNEKLKNDKNNSFENIPITSWYYPEFSKDLNNSIQDIVKNQSFPIPAKLKKIYTLISQFYHSQIDKQTNELKTILSKIQKNQTLLEESFELKDLNIIENVNDIISKYELLKNNFSGLENESKELNNKLEKMSSVINSNQEDIEQNVEKLYNENENLKQERKDNKNEIKSIKKQIKSILEQSNNEIEELQNQNNELNNKIQEMEKENSDYQQKLIENNLLNSQLKNEINKLNLKHQEDLDNIEEQKENEIDELKQEHSAEIEEYQQEMKKIISEKMAAIDSAEAAQHEITRLKKTTQLLKGGKKEQDDELFKLQTEIETIKNTMKEKSDKEKKQLKLQYQYIIDDLKSKNEELRELTEKATNALTSAEEEKQKVIKTRLLLENENEQTKQQYESLKQELIREKQLVETKIKATQLADDLGNQKKICEIKLEFEQKIHHILSLIASYFREDFDPSNSLTEETMIQLLQNSRNQLILFKNTDRELRHLLSIGNDDSIENAVQNLVLSIYQKE